MPAIREVPGLDAAHGLRHDRGMLPRVLWLAGLIMATALAEPMPGLFNTGVSEAGALLEQGADPHWRLVQSADPVAPGPSAYVVAEGFPIPPWLANGPESKWIAPRSDQGNGNPPGYYVYRHQSSSSPSTSPLRRKSPRRLAWARPGAGH